MAKTIKANGLDAILAELAEDGLRPGEFTAQQAFDRHKELGGTKSCESIRGLLKRMANGGDLLTRQCVLGGKVTNCYRPK